MKDFIHVLVAGVIGALAAYFNVLLVPLAVLVAVMLIDYVTGMAGAVADYVDAAIQNALNNS